MRPLLPALLTLLLAGCPPVPSPPAADDDDAGGDDDDDDEPTDPALTLEPTEADLAYIDHWLDGPGGAEFVSSLRWLPHFLHEQGSLSICLRLELEGDWTVDGSQVEAIRQQIEDSVWAWQRGLIGEPNWVRDQRVPVHLFGIATTPSVVLADPPDVPVYTNDSAACPDACSRFVYRAEDAPTYPDCTHPTRSHFDVNIWYSDFSFGAAGHGGDWGTRLDWELFLDELEGVPTVTEHELGHVAGLPDVYNYPGTLDGHERPEAIMVYADTIQDFDYLMLREAWALGWEAFYAP